MRRMNNPADRAEQKPVKQATKKKAAKKKAAKK